MPYIQLSGKRGQGKQTLVDEASFKAYGHLSWFLGDTGYAMRRPTLDDGSKVTIRLHRLVTEAPEGMVVDHRNHDRLDNRRANLRVCTFAENALNRKGTKGYVWDAAKSKWMVRYRGQFHGRYSTKDEAKRAYQLACSGVPYIKKKRKLYNLPSGVTKQFGKYRVRPTRNGNRHWLGAYSTVQEAEKALNEWKNRG